MRPHFAGLLALLCACAIRAQPYTVQLSPWAADSVRIQIAGPGNAISDPPLMALRFDGPPPCTTTTSGDGVSTFTNGNLRVDVDPATSLITATRVSDGAVLLKQTGLSFTAPNVPGTRAGSVSATVTFAGTPGEKVYGLGEHRTGVVNQMPFHKRFADSQDYGQSHGSDVSIPWYASSLQYGFVWNSPAYGFVDLSETALVWMANATLGVDMWITTLPDDFTPGGPVSPFTPLLSNYVDAVGHASTMPFYSTGFIQCKDRYRNQTQLLDVAREYVARQLPISVIVIDWKHWVEQGDWKLNPACWPDPQGMFDELQTLGIELMVTFWPFQSTESTNWQQFSSSGYLATNLSGALLSYDGGDQYLVDETNPDVRSAVFDKFMEGYGNYGIKTVWIDAAEPEHFGADQEGSWRFLAGTDAEVGSAWIQQHARIFHDGFAKLDPPIMASDYFILPRSAWAGSWRYSAALWSGDIDSTFEELGIQIKVLQGVMMSGPALWTTDIGGYNGGNPADPVFQDLIVRWFQFGAFSPLFRLHGHRAGGPPDDPTCGGTNGDNEVWNLATEPAHYDGIVAVMRLRENLRGFTAKINAQAAATGMPMIRPMFLQWPQDAGCQGADVEDQVRAAPGAPVTFVPRRLPPLPPAVHVR
jgi:alpha-D-xyloside xylohydrolase